MARVHFIHFLRFEALMTKKKSPVPKSTINMCGNQRAAVKENPKSSKNNSILFIICVKKKGGVAPNESLN
jgi:hypothetical protein